LEGRGSFTVGDEIRDAEPGELICAPAGVMHGVSNRGNERLSVLVAISPPPPTK
jgi:mannose-6-phosphate isomerase-like protein (cupin superfamily)